MSHMDHQPIVAFKTLLLPTYSLVNNLFITGKLIGEIGSYL